jgi:hypothetical protein
MKKIDQAPVRGRQIQASIYEDAGKPDFVFEIPQPFMAEHVEGVSAIGANPAGVAQQLNQVLAENLGNNLAARIKKAAKANQPLPTQEDMDQLYAEYDFTGMRSSTVSIANLFDRCFYKAAGQFLRKLFKKKGYQDMAAPVTVAKKGDEPNGQQISYEDFEAEIARLMDGEGPWAEKPAFVEARNQLIEEAKAEEERIRASQQAAESSLSNLDL